MRSPGLVLMGALYAVERERRLLAELISQSAQTGNAINGPVVAEAKTCAVALTRDAKLRIGRDSTVTEQKRANDTRGGQTFCSVSFSRWLRTGAWGTDVVRILLGGRGSTGKLQHISSSVDMSWRDLTNTCRLFAYFARALDETAKRQLLLLGERGKVERRERAR